MPAENREVTAVKNVELTSSVHNPLQDKTTLLKAATHEEGSLPPAFLGGTWITGEYTILPVTDKVLDNSRDWRDCMANMLVFFVAAANELPSGANHTPDDVNGSADMYWNLKDGETIGAPFNARDHWWKPFGLDLYLYADDTNGFLYASNTNGAGTYHFYFIFDMTDVIE